ncbi:MAG TPA: hypothetical protein VF528_20995 [Pyrinomonadaceae bacterium]
MSPKSRKRKIPSKRRSPKSPTASSKHSYGFEWMPSPFEGMTQEEADKRFIEIGEEHHAKYDESFARLQEEILKYDPLYVLSANSFYSTFDSDFRFTREPGRTRIFQNHLELLQSLVLRNRRDDYASSLAPPQAIHEIRELLNTCSKSFPMRRYANLDSSMSEEERQRMRVLEDIRTHTQSLRNWGYPQQVKRILVDLFAPTDDALEEETGVRIQSLVSMWFDISIIIIKRVQAHADKLAPVMGAKSVKEAVNIFWQAAQMTESTPEDLIKFLEEKGLSVENTRIFLLSYSDRFLSDVYTLTFKDFADAYQGDVNETTLKKIIAGWSLSFGDLARDNPEHFFLGNPVWRRPLIRLDEDRYFMPVPGLFLSFSLELMEDVIRPIPALRNKYERRRAKYLEDEIERLFSSGFPSAKVYRGSLWSDPITGKDFENDLLVIIDSYQIVIEAKSGKVSDPARRGAPFRLEQEIRELMVEPSLQAKRFADYLQANHGEHTFKTLSGAVNYVDNRLCHETIRLNVTLDILANVQARWPDLHRAGFIPKGADLGVTLSLTDLELVFELFDTACEKLHYLARRSELERNAHYLADETDLLAFYIDNGFNVGEAEYDGTGLWIYGISEILNPYFMSVWTGEKVPKPKRRYTKWWQRILDRMEQQPIARWSEIGYMLLNLSYDEQEFFERQFRRIQHKVKNVKSKAPQQEAYFMLSGAAQRRNAVIGLAYKGVTKDQRHDMIPEAALQVFQEEPVKRVLVIGVNVERTIGDDYPYGILTCVFREALADYLDD